RNNSSQILQLRANKSLPLHQLRRRVARRIALTPAVAPDARFPRTANIHQTNRNAPLQQFSNPFTALLKKRSLPSLSKSHNNRPFHARPGGWKTKQHRHLNHTFNAKRKPLHANAITLFELLLTDLRRLRGLNRTKSLGPPGPQPIQVVGILHHNRRISPRP